MISLPPTVTLHPHGREREHADDDVLDLNLTALEQQFFVEWEVPEPAPPGDDASV
ncbi:MAG: hypothetical protein ACRD12_05715 [Acidimicrobiales bacterium]